MKRFYLILVLLCICLEIMAQTPTQERRIYIVDVTASMEGRGVVETPDIFDHVKKSLASTIDHIDDNRTEVIIIPFTNKPFNCFSGAIAKKDSIKNYINTLSIKKGDTNIADAWQEGLTYIDSTKVNYLFLLTDGLHNYGPAKDELYSRLSSWGEQSQGKYMFAFYVMLTPNAKELEICKIVEETRNLWLIESMDIDASLIQSKTLLKTNVFENNQSSISFVSNNSSLDLNAINLKLSLEDNPYYEIRNVEKSVMTNTFRYNIIEKIAKREIPVIDTIGLVITHDKEKYPFVFFTPDYIDFVIANQGTRTVSISEDSFWGEELSMLNLHKIKYKEPFRGPFKWGRAWFEPTLDFPPFKWLKPDTAVVAIPINITFNEEAIRGNGSVKFFFCNENGDQIDFIRTNTDSLIVASEDKCSISYHCSIIPGAREKMIHGHLFAATANLDKVNNTEVSSGFDYFADWKAIYKQPWPIILWLLWILTIILILGLIGLILYGLVRLIVLIIVGLYEGLCAIGHYFCSIFSKLEGVADCRVGAAQKSKKRANGSNRNEERKETNNCSEEQLLIIESLLYSPRKVTRKYELLEEMRFCLDKIYIDDKHLYDRIKMKLKENTWNALEDAWKIWDPTPKNTGNWGGPKNMTFFLDKRSPYYDECKARNFLKCTYDEHGSPNFDAVTYKGSIVDISDLYDTMSVNQVEKRGGGKSSFQEIAQLKIEANLKSVIEKWAQEKSIGYDQETFYKWRDANDLVPHEDTNCKTIRLVYRPAHKAFTHRGGVSNSKNIKNHFS